jgi:predicted DNA-binding transcriptional regulator AlpA
MNDDKLLLPKEVESLTRLSDTTIWRQRRKGKFPSPVALTGEKRIAYRESEIRAWIEGRQRVTSQTEAA